MAKVLLGTIKANGDLVTLFVKDGWPAWEFPANPDAEEQLNDKCVAIGHPDTVGYPQWPSGMVWLSTHGFDLGEASPPPREPTSDDEVRKTGRVY